MTVLMEPLVQVVLLVTLELQAEQVAQGHSLPQLMGVGEVHPSKVVILVVHGII
jgi:hypothetical protein